MQYRIAERSERDEIYPGPGLRFFGSVCDVVDVALINAMVAAD